VLIPAVVQVGIVGIAFAVGFVIDRRYVGSDRTLEALPLWSQFVVAGVAMSPLIAHSRGLLPTTVVDDAVLMFVLMIGLWIALPAVAFELLDPDPADTETAC
jgi:hypothetical protein